MNRRIMAVGLTGAVAAVLVSALLVARSASSSTPETIDAGTHACTTDGSGYCPGQAHGLGSVPVAVVVTAKAPIAGAGTVQTLDADSFTAATFRVRAFKANGSALANAPIVYSYAAFSGPAPSPTPSSSTSPSDTTSPSPSDTSTAPAGNGFPNAGQAIGASNTGLVGAGVDESTLVADATVNYDSSFNGQTISGKLYTHRINITGNNITIRNCKVLTGGLDVFGIDVTGDNDTIDHCTVTAPAGQSLYEPIFLSPGSDGDVVTYNDISRGENLMTTYGTHATIAHNFMHDNAMDSNPGDHPDGIEVYGGGPVLISANRIAESSPYDSPVNTAPWGSYTLTDMSVVDNFIDGGQEMAIVYNQNTGGFLRNTRVERNAMGGHTNPDTNISFGIYKALLKDGRPVVETEAQLAANPNAVLWPTSGADVNRWEETGSLVPDRAGQTVLPTCPSPC